MGNLFNSIKRFFNAKADEAASAIEADNLVAFSKQDLEEMRKDLTKIISNIGSVAAEIDSITRKIEDVEKQIAKHDADAKALVDAGNESLAEQHCAKAETLETTIIPLKSALDVQQKQLAEQEMIRDELKQAIDEAEAALITMKAMESSVKANESMAKISGDSVDSAQANFKRRQEDLQKRLVASQTIRKESTDDLESQTKAALGKTAGSSRLARLKSESTEQ